MSVKADLEVVEARLLKMEKLYRERLIRLQRVLDTTDADLERLRDVLITKRVITEDDVRDDTRAPVAR